MASANDIKPEISSACKYSDALQIAKVAEIVYNDILSHKSKFDGKFDVEYQERSVLTSLLVLFNMIENGPDIKSQLEFGKSISDLALPQILSYNCLKRLAKRTSSNYSRPSKD